MEELSHLLDLIWDKLKVEEKVGAMANAMHEFSERHEILVAMLNVLFAFFRWIVILIFSGVILVVRFAKLFGFFLFFFVAMALFVRIGIPILIAIAVVVMISKFFD